MVTTKDGPNTSLFKIQDLKNGEKYDFRMLAKDKDDRTVCCTSEKIEIKGIYIYIKVQLLHGTYQWFSISFYFEKF